jgi:hypothetical protein
VPTTSSVVVYAVVVLFKLALEVLIGRLDNYYNNNPMNWFYELDRLSLKVVYWLLG